MPLPKTLVALAAATAALSMAPALAASATIHEQSKEISVIGYDLNDAADAEIVLGKIQSAAKKVCTLSVNRDTLRERAQRRRCADKATTIAVESMSSPTLSGLWQEKLNS